MTHRTITAFLIGLIGSFGGGTLGLMAASPISEVRTEQVFVYGTLMNPIVRAYACVCFTELTTTKLAGYQKTGRNIIPDPDSTVAGGIIEVSPKELRRLDDYENVPEQYKRQRITLDGTSAWVYIEQ